MSVQTIQGENKVLCSVLAVIPPGTTWSGGPITLSATVPPSAGFTISFGTNPISVGDSSTVFGDFTNASANIVYIVEIKGSSGGIESVQSLVVAVLPTTSTTTTLPMITLNPDSGQVGDRVVMTGSGFTQDGYVLFYGFPDWAICHDGIDSSWSYAFEVPQADPGEYPVYAVDGGSGNASNTVMFTVLQTTTTTPPTTATPTATTTTLTTTAPAGPYISLQGVELETKSIYPNPYLCATVFVNANVPLYKLTLFVNGAYEETSFEPYHNVTSYVEIYKARPSNPAMPIIAGRTYEITFVATFQDNSTSTASASVVAE